MCQCTMKSYAHWKLGWVLLPLVAAERIIHFCEKKTLRWIVVLNWFHARSIHIEMRRLLLMLTFIMSW